jgi:hypothetical protein
MNRRNELPPELQAAYDEGYALALAGGWLDSLPQEASRENHGESAQRSLLQRVIAHQIGFIDGLKGKGAA